MENLKTTLILIPGGEELTLPENAERLRKAMRVSLEYKTARILMLADESIIPDKVLQTLAKYKTVLLVESNEITDEEDAYRVALEQQAENYLPVVASTGFDFQVIQMEPVPVKYEDFEILEKYL